MRNINEFNIPHGNSHGYEILYFGVNLILMLNYRLSFDVCKEFKQGNSLCYYGVPFILKNTAFILINTIMN